MNGSKLTGWSNIAACIYCKGAAILDEDSGRWRCGDCKRVYDPPCLHECDWCQDKAWVVLRHIENCDYDWMREACIGTIYNG